MILKLKESYKQFKEFTRKEDTANAIEFPIIVVMLVVIFFK